MSRLNNSPLDKYVVTFKGAIPKELLDRVNTFLDTKAEWKEHTFYSPEKDVFSVNGKDCLQSSTYSQEAKEVMDIMKQCISFYIGTQNKSDYYSSWNGYSQIEFHKYGVGTEMKLHCDHIHSLFDGERKGVPVLTMVGLLNNEFEGGEFAMFDNKLVLPLQAGDITLFPANFLYPHQVSEVTKGTRTSFVSWVW